MPPSSLLRPITSSLLRKACTAPGTSRQLPSSASSRVAASLQKHTERIQKVRQQAAKPPCRPKPSRSPVVAARQTSISVVLSSSFASSVSLFQELSLETAKPQARSTIPLLTRRHVSTRPLRSCLKAPKGATLGRQAKRVHFNHPLKTKSDLRFYEPDEPCGTDPVSDASPNITPHMAGGVIISRIRIPHLTGSTLRPQYTHTRYNGIFLEPSREGLKGPDGQLGRCPYCISNASFGGWVPAFPDNLESTSEADFRSHWWLETEKLHCEDHE